MQEQTKSFEQSLQMLQPYLRYLGKEKKDIQREKTLLQQARDEHPEWE
jgi:hypothetical protein